jgi:hypothetical protein
MCLRAILSHPEARRAAQNGRYARGQAQCRRGFGQLYPNPGVVFAVQKAHGAEAFCKEGPLTPSAQTPGPAHNQPGFFA